jgi:hypothetical protein
MRERGQEAQANAWAAERLAALSGRVKAITLLLST